MLARIKKNDKIFVISGRDKGKEGKVLEVDTKKDRIMVKGINIVTKHSKPRKQGDQGGIIKKEASMPSCKVMPVCPACKKPCRTKTKTVDGGKRSRACHRCNGEF